MIVVGLLFAAGRMGSELIRAGHGLFGYALANTVGNVIVAAIGVWACLGLGHLGARIPLMVVGVALVGLSLAMGLGHGAVDVDWVSDWVAMYAADGAFLGVSLLVFRSCGYRVVPIGSQRQTRPEAGQ
jgi:hypothetical protein